MNLDPIIRTWKVGKSEDRCDKADSQGRAGFAPDIANQSHKIIESFDASAE